MTELTCWNCGAGLAEIPLPLSRRANCLACFAELHCCLQCRWFVPKRAEQCTEERAEPPTRKDVANFCEWFEPDAGLAPSQTPEERARADLDELFAGAASHEAATDRADGEASASQEDGDGNSEDEARRRLDDLFG